jgi:ATP synthase subunit 6
MFSNFSRYLNLYTPLEQFDEVTWLSHRVIETVAPYILFISEREFDARQRYTNSYSASSSSIFFSSRRNSESQLRVLLLIVGLIWHFAPAIRAQIASFTEGFSHLFFLAAIHIFTGIFFSFWFTDFFFITEQVNTNGNAVVNIFGDAAASFNYILAPQFDLSLAIDEIRITLILGFFLIGGKESEDEEDFLLADEADLDIVEEVVAPLFVANLGKDIAENGALYLKVCSIFSFVLISNLRGRIPYGDTATSSLILTFWVALAVFAALVALRIRKHGFNYFFSLFRPSGCPLPLIFLLIPIEFLSYSFRLVSLAVRLFANRRAGHTLRKVLIGFSYVRFTLGDGYAVAAFLPALVVFVLIFLERAVAGIQAYIFTILTCIYLKDLYVAH